MDLEEVAEARKDCVVFGHLSRPLIDWLRDNAPKEFRSEVRDWMNNTAEYDSPENNKYVYRAWDEIAREGEIEVDENALVSRSDDGGAYVMAWAWVQDEEIEDDKADATEELQEE